MGNPSTRAQRAAVINTLRHRGERLAFLLTLFPFIVWVIVSGSTTMGAAFVVFVIAWLWLSFQLDLSRARLLAHGVRVSDTQLPTVMSCIERCHARLPVGDPVDVIVVQGSELNAYTFGARGQPAIVLTSGLVKALTEDELTAVIAHEWGHLYLGHARLGGVFGALIQHGFLLRQVGAVATQVGGSPPSRGRATGRIMILALLAALVTLLAPILFLAYRRFSEISADRASLLVLGEAGPPARALARIAVGPDLAEHLNHDELIAQAEQLGATPAGLIQQLLSDHPFVGSRLRAMRAWSGSTGHLALIALTDPPPGS